MSASSSSSTALFSSMVLPVIAPVREGTRTLGARVLTGRSEILAMSQTLIRLSERSGQPGAMDHLQYFLTLEQSLKKTPYLVLIGREEELSSGTQGDVCGALLIYEYRVAGLGTGIFSTDDTTGRRTLIAPPESRMLVARLAAQALMKRGARIIVQSLLEAEMPAEPISLAMEQAGDNSWKYAVQNRTIPSFLPLQKTMTETLAAIGQRTRSNMRYYRRRAESQLGSTFVEQAILTREEFLAFNKQCAFAVPDERAVWRHDIASELPGIFICGMRGTDGQWLSLVGGRRYHDMVEIDWQMNRADLPAYSLSTVMRSYFIEHEISLGTRKMFIEGGTPHAMRFSFVEEGVRDLVIVRYPRLVSRLVKLIGRYVPKTNFTLQILTEAQLDWKPWLSA